MLERITTYHHVKYVPIVPHSGCTGIRTSHNQHATRRTCAHGNRKCSERLCSSIWIWKAFYSSIGSGQGRSKWPVFFAIFSFIYRAKLGLKLERRSNRSHKINRTRSEKKYLKQIVNVIHTNIPVFQVKISNLWKKLCRKLLHRYQMSQTSETYK